jgi:putative multiple sugar transport system substrate-binding protein
MKKVLVLILSLALMTSLLACGAQETSDGKTPDEGKVAETPDKEAPDGSKDVIRVGVSMPTKSGERWIRDGDAIKSGLEALGYEVDLQFAEDQINAQVSQIENMIMQGVDALVIAPIDGSTMTDVCKKAKEQGAYVIAYDRLIMNTEDVDYYITFDSIQIGKLQGGYIVEKLGLKDGKGPFNIELFAGSLDDNNAPLYFEGGMEELQPYLDSGQLVVKSGQTELNQVAIHNWDGQVAQARMDDILSAHYSDGSRVDAVLSPYDGLSIGILASLKAIGYGSDDLPFPIITGQDCEVPSVKSIIAGEQTHSIFIDTRALGQACVEVVHQCIEKGEAEVNLPEAFDNGAKKVSAVGLSAHSVDITNYKELLIDSGYLTEEELQ